MRASRRDTQEGRRQTGEESGEAGGRESGGTWEAGKGSASELDLLGMKLLVRPRQCFHLLHIS